MQYPRRFIFLAFLIGADTLFDGLQGTVQRFALVPQHIQHLCNADNEYAR